MAASSEMIERKEFTCPRCGSHEYGSAQLSATPLVLERICHGYIEGQACGFRWLDKDDDRFFGGTGDFYPRTAFGRLQECIACRAKSVPLIVRLQRGTVLKGWHDVSSFVSSGMGDGSMSEPETKWLCDHCTRGTLQCGKCKTRFNSAEQRCPSCNPKEPAVN